MANVKSGIPILTAGTELAYAVETTAGTMPTSAHFIPDIISIPDMSAEPEKIDVTDLSCLKYKKHMKLSKLKENMSSFGLENIDAKSLIPDFSFKAPTISRAAFEQPTGTVREAYAQATQFAPYDYNNADGMEANVTIYNYLEMDGDIVAEKVETRRVDMQRRMNGR